MAKKIAPVHPGAYLRELMEELDVTAYRLAKHIGVSPMRLSLVLRGQRPVSADLALRLEKALGQSAQYWLNLQSRYDLDVLADSATPLMKGIKPLLAA